MRAKGINHPKVEYKRAVIWDSRLQKWRKKYWSELTEAEIDQEADAMLAANKKLRKALNY